MNPYDDSRTKREQVEEMFDRIAPVYDRANDLMSLGMARRWRRIAAREVRRTGAQRVLDIATGTGDLAIAVMRRLPDARVTGVDISAEMLSRAHVKAARARMSDKIDFIEAEAEALPFAAGEFDVVTVAFGVRNFADIRRGLCEMARVLRSDGRVFMLEFSIPRSKIFGPLYRFYFRRFVPWVGGLLSRQRRTYDYLPASVAEFAAPPEFIRMMHEAGFYDCRARPIMGGAVYLYTGTKHARVPSSLSE
ncbi:MAG: bifunctional demethylmenaquinone methyltransferase/2-methoxy-6-polyprenyl-1,4-benzoquinol methylase UbiE [Rikenellaceae bacterium]|nr:bifunctional demethylmenaquinone methyltransferase/2-methoxy-6-polyprenyl-1,4-benzoquinol methylase UbiE [Rikenellaceae bacterium]MCL2693353.1 bifunctional demethylmenaquinone methyltransferase/2-methoxy-6-polyprenyl-1,4-benzoquinol methylase UbiE [Rikenellaceae bacterium]